jgi:YidC/Oxa1 family membrane protein insertase
MASVWISYTTWVTENPPETPIEVVADGVSPTNVDELPTLNDTGDLSPAAGGADVAEVPGTGQSAEPARTLSVRTDVLDILINLDGGDIVRADLPRYPVHKDTPDIPVRLLDYEPDTLWIFQTGLVSLGDRPAPNHQQAFTSASRSYTLAEGQDTLEVRLEWSGPDGLRGAKIYTFQRGEYAIDLELEASNGGSDAWPVIAYAQMSRHNVSRDRSFLDVDTYSFNGPVLYDGNKYEKLKFGDLQEAPVEQTVVDGWMAGIQHHFLGGIVPLNDEPTRYEARVINDRYRLRSQASGVEVAAGASFSYPLKLFIGPKLQDQLDAAAPGRDLKLTVDYGMLTFLSHPLFLLLSLIHGWVKNWGWAIIGTTFLIKLVFYKLTATSGRSMAKMRKLAPRMKALQEKHKDDRQALSAAMMELYKKEKVNPAAGCLPILIQMPFLYAFYWVLVESVELRQAPFALWINDLSARDPFFILPGLMLAAMMFQMRLNPAPPDPVQAKVMMIMPIFFAGMFAFFPAGMVLYWLTNTIVSIAQQWRINQLVARES